MENITKKLEIEHDLTEKFTRVMRLREQDNEKLILVCRNHIRDFVFIKSPGEVVAHLDGQPILNPIQRCICSLMVFFADYPREVADIVVEAFLLVAWEKKSVRENIYNVLEYDSSNVYAAYKASDSAIAFGQPYDEWEIGYLENILEDDSERRLSITDGILSYFHWYEFRYYEWRKTWDSRDPKDWCGGDSDSD